MSRAEVIAETLELLEGQGIGGEVAALAILGALAEHTFELLHGAITPPARVPPQTTADPLAAATPESVVNVGGLASAISTEPAKRVHGRASL